MRIVGITRSWILLAFALVLTPGLARADWGSDLWGEMIWGGPVAVPALPGGGLLLALLLVGSASWALLRGKRRVAAALGTLALAAPLLSQAEEITFPHTFTNGTIADADEVNQNFGAVSFAFDKFTDQFGLDPSSPSVGTVVAQGFCDTRVIGEVWQFAGVWEPEGTLFAHGQLLSIVQYPSLFTVLETRYGGDGRMTFRLPDLRGLEVKGVNYVICMFGPYPLEN